jgi:hypothetical protein
MPEIETMLLFAAFSDETLARSSSVTEVQVSHPSSVATTARRFASGKYALSGSAACADVATPPNPATTNAVATALANAHLKGCLTVAALSEPVLSRLVKAFIQPTLLPNRHTPLYSERLMLIKSAA